MSDTAPVVLCHKCGQVAYRDDCRGRAILLVAGSRAYPGSPDAVFKMVLDVCDDFAFRNWKPGVDLVLVHGASPVRGPNSIDWVADRVARHLGWKVAKCAVDHEKDGPWPQAGPRRSKRMVSGCVRERDRGAVVEVAGFPWKHDATEGGTVGCLKLARSAGLTVGVHGG